MSWAFYPAQASFAQYAADWDRLSAALYGSHPYYDSRFVGPLLKYFADGKEILCVHREQGGINGAVILQSRGMGRWAIFRPAQAQITPILVADAGLLKQLLKALPGFAWSIDFYAIDPRYAPAFSCASDDVIISTQARTIGVESGTPFEAYWNHRPKNLRSNIRRYSNRLEREAGRSEFSCLNAVEAMTDGVRRFGELETAGWKAAAGTNVSIDNLQGQFYAEVLSRFSATSQAEVCELTIGGQLAASRLLIGNQQMQVILKTTYDEGLARFAPSRLMLYQLIERQLDQHPERTIEFYTNATRDQVEWASFSCNIHNVQLFRNGAAVLAYTFLKALKYRNQGNPVAEPRADEVFASLVVTSCASVGELVAEGVALDQFWANESIEDSLEWFDLLQKQVFPNDPGVRYYLTTEQGKPAAILPLRKTRQGAVCTLESLSNYYTSLYPPLMDEACDSKVFGRLLAAATRDNRNAHVMRFAPMDPYSPAYPALLNELRATGWVPLTFFCFGNWFLKVDGSWDDYLSKRSGNLRSSIKRRNREFFARGGTLEIVSGAEDLEQGIAAYLEVYAASWKKPEPYPDFVPSLIRLLAAKGMLRLGIARLDGQAIAAQLWIVGKTKASIYKVAYHEAHATLSPGTVLTSYLLRHVIEHDQVNEVDFLIGDDEYKKIWMSDRRERWGIVAFNRRTFIGCILMAKEIVGRMVKRTSSNLVVKLSPPRHDSVSSQHG